MKLTFLGTGAGAPSRSRNVSAIALSFQERGDLWLFDCGEGTQHRFMESSVSVGRLSTIFITHLHGDHIFGLPGLLSTRSLSGDGRGIDLYGPPGIEEFLETAFRLSETTLGYRLRIIPIGDGHVVTDGDISVECATLDHRIRSFGFRIAERERPGSLDAARAVALGAPAGPLHGRLKRGETIVLPDGRSVSGHDLCGAPIPGRVVVICGDTTHSPASIELARGADLLVHEATFAGEHDDVARISRHSTAGMAASVAAEAGVARLIITHISSRYGGGGEDRLLAEAREVFPETEMARDYMEWEVPRKH